MLTDRDVEEIERQRAKGVSGGPIVLSWLDRLLADRKQRLRQVQHLRQRLNQACRYLDGLLRDMATGRPPAPRPKPRPVCTSCGKPYARAYGISPNGMAFVHEGGRECRLND